MRKDVLGTKKRPEMPVGGQLPKRPGGFEKLPTLRHSF
jgi:hypothetical protein